MIYEILPGKLYQRGKLHSLRRDVKEAGLEHYGITSAVSLAPAKEDPDIRDFLCDYLHHPIPDGPLKEPDYLQGLAGEYARLIDSHGETVLTMCNAGRNRSGLLSALIVRHLTGLPGYAAMQIVREQRPNALANPYFEAYLEGLE